MSVGAQQLTEQDSMNGRQRGARNSPAQSSEQRRVRASRGQPGGVKAKLIGGKWSRGGGDLIARGSTGNARRFNAN